MTRPEINDFMAAATEEKAAAVKARDDKQRIHNFALFPYIIERKKEKCLFCDWVWRIQAREA